MSTTLTTTPHHPNENEAPTMLHGLDERVDAGQLEPLLQRWQRWRWRHPLLVDSPWWLVGGLVACLLSGGKSGLSGGWVTV